MHKASQWIALMLLVSLGTSSLKGQTNLYFGDDASNINITGNGSAVAPFAPDTTGAATLSWSTIFSALNIGNVSVTNVGSPQTWDGLSREAGDIGLVQAPNAQGNSGNYNSNNDLSVSAMNNVTVYTALTNQGSGNLNLTGCKTVEINQPLNFNGLTMQSTQDHIVMKSNITTTGSAGQTYNGNVSIGAGNLTFTSTGGGDIVFNGTVQTPGITSNVTFNNSGNLVMNGAWSDASTLIMNGTGNFLANHTVGASWDIMPIILLVDNEPTIVSDRTTVGARSNGSAYFNNSVTVLSGGSAGGNGDSTFNGTVTVQSGGAAGSSGNSTFNGNVTVQSGGSAGGGGNNTFNGNVTVQSGGSIASSSEGNIVFNNSITLNPITRVGGSVGSNVYFNGTTVLQSGTANQLFLGNNAYFNSAVTGTSFVMQVGNTVTINGGSFNTTGSQEYQSPIHLNTDTTLAAGGTLNMTFDWLTGLGVNSTNNGFDGAHALTLTTPSSIFMRGAIGNVTPLTNVTVNNGGTASFYAPVVTTGDQYYAGAVSTQDDAWPSFSGVQPMTSFTSLQNGNITFNGSLQIQFRSALQTGGNVSFKNVTTNTTFAVQAGNVTFNGTATLNNLFTLQTNGSISIGPSGVLSISGNSALPTGSGSAVFNLAGGVFQPVSSNVSTALAFTLATNTSSTINSNGLGVTLSGVISGSGALTKNGTGTLTLNNTNTFTGSTTVSAGILLLANATALQNSTLASNTSGGTLSFGTLTTATLGGLSGNQTLALANNSSAAVALAVGGNNQNTTFSGILSGGGGLTKTGAGTLTLNATNTYTGNTTISAGTILLANTNALQNSTLVYNANGGTLSFGSLTSATLGGLSGNKDLALANNSSGAVTLALGGNNLSSTYSGNLTGNGALTKIGTGTQTLTGVNSLVGDTVVNNGTLNITSSGSLTSGYIAMGEAGGSNGTLTVDATAVQSTGDVMAGNFGMGNLNVVNGGNVSAGDIFFLGENANSSGKALVTGANSKLSAVNGLTVGDQGAGNLTVANGGNLTTHSTLVLGAGNTGNGVLLVTDANSTVSVVNNTLTVGANGTGSLTVTNGGNIYASSPNPFGTSLTLGLNATGNGTMLVTGANSIVNTDAFINIGTNGTGSLTVANGGVIIAQGQVGLGYNATGNGTLLVTGASSSLSATRGLDMGINGRGNLTVANGGAVTSSLEVILGFNSGANGTALITGANSTMNTNGIRVGDFGNGTMTVANGGNVTDTAHLSIGVFGGTAGTVTVTDTNSLLSVAGLLKIGGPGNGTLTLANGGQVSAPGNLLLGQNTGGNAMVNLNSGTLNVGGTDGIAAGTGNYAFNFGGGTLKVTGSDLTTIVNATLASATSSNLDTSGLKATLSGVISGSGALIKTGGGTLTLNATNTYNGSTTISLGTLLLANAGALQNSTLNYNVGDGNLSFGTLTNATFGGLSGNRDLALANNSSAALTLTIGGNNQTTTYSGNFSGNGALTKSGLGSLTLTGNSTFTGNTKINSGTLALTNGSNLTTNMTTLGEVAGANATLTLDAAGIRSNSYMIVGNVGGGSLLITNGSVATIAANTNGINSDSFGLRVANGTNSTGTVTVTGHGSQLNTAFNAGGIRLGTNGTGSLLVANGGLVALNGADHYNNIGLSVGLFGNGAVTVTDSSSEIDVIRGGLTLNAFEANSSLTITNGGVVNVNGTFNSQGTDVGLAIQNGNTSVIVTGSGSRLNVAGEVLMSGSGNSTLTVANGGVANFTGFNGFFVGNLSDGQALITGSGSELDVTFGTSVGSDAGSFGNSTLTIANGGVANLGGLNGISLLIDQFSFEGFSGVVTVTGANSTLNSSNGSVVVGRNHTGTLTIANGGTMVIVGNNLTLAANASANGTVNLNANGTLKIGGTDGIQAGAGNYTFNLSGGTLQVTGTDLTTAINATLTTNTTSTFNTNGLNATWSGVLSGGGNLTKSGTGNLTLSGSNAYTGNTALNAGALIFSQTVNVTYNGTISGSGAITQSGNATLTLGGNNTYTGNTTINTGTLVLSGNTAALGGNIVDNTTLVFNQSANSSFGQAISGSGTLAKSGNGSLTLSGNNTYTGNTTVSAGTLIVSNNGTVSATGAGTVNVAANATLAGVGRINGTAVVNGTLQTGSAGSAGLLTFAQILALGTNTTSRFQLGGTTRGTQYSAVNVLGNAGLAGTLVINLFNNFLPGLGITFNLFQVTGSIFGTFSSYNLAPIDLNIGWNTSQLGLTGNISTGTINFAQWTTAAGLSGNNALPAAKPFKGQANALRYAMNLDLSGAPAGAPSLSLVNDSGTNFLVIQYRVRKNMTDYQLVPQYSTNMVDWTNVPAGNIAQLLDADTYTARYQASVVFPAHGSLMLRVQAQPVP